MHPFALRVTGYGPPMLPVAEQATHDGAYNGAHRPHKPATSRTPSYWCRSHGHEDLAPAGTLVNGQSKGWLLASVAPSAGAAVVDGEASLTFRVH